MKEISRNSENTSPKMNIAHVVSKTVSRSQGKNVNSTNNTITLRSLMD